MVYNQYASSVMLNQKVGAFNALANAVGSTFGQAIEFWLYNPGGGANQLIEEPANGNYMFSLCISNNLLNVDIYTSTTHASNSVTFSHSNHFAADITSFGTLPPWVHVVVQGTGIAAGIPGTAANLQVYLQGKPLTDLPVIQPCNCSWTVAGTATAITYPDNYATLKNMRIYSRLMTPAEILTNAGDECLSPSNPANMAWYRFHVPSAGDSTTVAGNSTVESTLIHYYPLTVIPTNYVYNSTDQVSRQASPDGGTNSYWYDLLSRLTVSQNSKQLPLNNYSYTRYDTIGRITEVGQKNQAALNIGSPHYLTNDTLTMFYTAGADSQITRTYYDAPVPTVAGHTDGIATVSQNNLRKRVSASTYSPAQGGPAVNATYYSYDLDGNVQTLWQQVNGLYIPASNSGLKEIDYEYDLVSGKAAT